MLNQRVEGGVTLTALHDRLDLGAVLVVVAQRQQGNRGLPRLVVSQDQQTIDRHALG